jgi:hypothetical protein
MGAGAAHVSPTAARRGKGLHALAGNQVAAGQASRELQEVGTHLCCQVRREQRLADVPPARTHHKVGRL